MQYIAAKCYIEVRHYLKYIHIEKSLYFLLITFVNLKLSMWWCDV